MAHCTHVHTITTMMRMPSILLRDTTTLRASPCGTGQQLLKTMVISFVTLVMTKKKILIIFGKTTLNNGVKGNQQTNAKPKKKKKKKKETSFLQFSKEFFFQM
eukprot:PhF_6_TR27400/c0_g1_i1/m.40335